MDARHEPRFSIYGPVKVTVLSSPERVLDCVLTEISATGIKMIAPESLTADEIISMEAEDHLALADVRYSQPRGDKFTVGCERIHVLNKVSLPDEKSKVEQIRLLVEDYRNRISSGIATPRPDIDQAQAARLEREIADKCASPEAAAPPPEKPVAEAPVPAPVAAPPQAPLQFGPFATREQLLNAAGALVVEHWDKTQAPEAGQAGRSEIVDRLTFHLAEKLRAPIPAPQVVPDKATQKTKKVAPKTPTKFNFRRWRIPVGLAAAALAWLWTFGAVLVLGYQRCGKPYRVFHCLIDHAEGEAGAGCCLLQAARNFQSCGAHLGDADGGRETRAEQENGERRRPGNRIHEQSDGAHRQREGPGNYIRRETDRAHRWPRAAPFRGIKRGRFPPASTQLIHQNWK